MIGGTLRRNLAPDNWRNAMTTNQKKRKMAWYGVKGWAAGAVLACLSGMPGITGAESITMVSWGGSYAKAWEKAILKPFSAETGIEVRLESYNGGLAQIRAQVETGSVHWDIVDLEFADLSRGCDEGLFEFVDIDQLPPAPDGTLARVDYYDGTYSDCGGSGIFYSTVYAYNSKSFPGEKPSTIEDYFDLEKFPGRRGMRRTPAVNLEFALMADGVPSGEVYEVLDSPDGMDRAFRKLDTIKDQIVWWEAGAQPPQMLADQEVVMSTAYNGRIFNAQVIENQPLVIVWDGQVLDYGQIAIVTGTPNLELARKFLQYSSKVESMAAIGRYIAYSPTRRSGVDLFTTHAETGVEMRPHMPSAPENLKRALHNDWEWWSDNAEEVHERFSAWLNR